jgi:hypothetical protein
MSRYTLKSSTIFISVGDKTRVYRSVDDVPPRLRKKLEQSTNGDKSATILIADRRGRQEIARAIRGLPSGVRFPGPGAAPTITPDALADRSVPSTGEAPEIRRRRMMPVWIGFVSNHWMEILLPPAVGAVVWFLSTLK